MKNIFSLSLVSLVASSISFIFLPFISAQLTLESFAEYSFLYSIGVVLASTFLFGTSSSYSLAIAEQDRDYAQQAVQLFVTVNAIFGVFLFFLSIVYALFMNGGVGGLFLPLFVIGRSAYLLTSHYFRVHKKTNYFTLYQLCTLLTSFCLPLGLCILVDDFSGVDFISVMGVVMTVSGLWGIYLFKKEGYLELFIVNPVKISFFRFGFFASVHSLVAALITVVDRFILITFVEKEVFAVYALGASLAASLSLIYSVLNQNLAPDFYAKMKLSNNSNKVLCRYFIFYLVVIVFVFLIYQMSIDKVVELFFSVEYVDAIEYARLISFASLVQGVYFFASLLLMYLNLSDKLFQITACVGGWSIASGLFVYQYFGVVGVIYNCILVWSLYALITTWVSIRALNKFKNFPLLKLGD